MRYTAFLIALMFCIPVFAQSLLQQTVSPYDPLPKPKIQKYDHIQIKVIETARGSARGDLRTDRRTRWEFELDKWIRFDVSARGHRRLRAAALEDSPGIDLDTRLRFDNTGETTRYFELKLNITARVVDVKPNGILVLEAIKRRRINEDVEVIKLTGEVHPRFIDENYTVRSDKIANLDISYEASGSVGDVSKRGFFGWLFGLFF
jgi:flagellar L-ring protein precursor FlgH